MLMVTPWRVTVYDICPSDPILCLLGISIGLTTQRTTLFAFAGGGIQPIQPNSFGIEVEVALGPSGGFEVEEAFGPSPYAPTAGNPPAWSSQPPSVGIGAAVQYTRPRGTNGAIRKSRTSGQDPSRIGSTQPCLSACCPSVTSGISLCRPGLIYWGQQRLFGTSLALDSVSFAAMMSTRQPHPTVLAGYFHGANYP